MPSCKRANRPSLEVVLQVKITQTQTRNGDHHNAQGNELAA